MDGTNLEVGRKIVRFDESVDEFVDSLYGISREERAVLNVLRALKKKGKGKFKFDYD